MMPPMYVRAIGLWTLAAPSLPEWLAPYAHAPGTLPGARLLSTRARGRSSMLTRMFAEVLEQVTSGDAVGARSALPMVFGSGNGELQTTSVLLHMMNTDDGALSPARFQASVHNAAAGQLSMALHSRGFATCLAAGSATAAACLEEASVYLALHGGEIVVALADESAPDFMASLAPCQPLALALRLAASSGSDGAAMRLRLTEAAPSAFAETALAVVNPCAAALPLWQALLERRAATLRLTSLWACNAAVEPPDLALKVPT